jgi:hypothetical protein
MLFQYSRYGEGVDSLGEVYSTVYGAYLEDRNTIMMSDSLRRKSQRFKSEAQFDLKRITAKYLIDQIESAFKAYHRYEWSRQYSFEMFCEYILPYHIKNSDTTRWRDYAYEKYGPLMEYASYYDAKSKFELESYAFTKSNRVRQTSASNQWVYNLVVGDTLHFKYDANKTGKHLFQVHYFSGHKLGSKVNVLLNDKVFETRVFPSTGSWNTIDENVPPISVSLELDSGMNTLSFVGADRNVWLDFIEIPEYVYMKFPESLIEGGNYYLSTSFGQLYVPGDTLINETSIKLDPNRIEADFVEVVPKDGNLYQFVLHQKNGPHKAIDAFPFDQRDWMLVYEHHGYENQSWGLIPQKNGGYQIRNKQTGRIMAYRETDSTLVQLHPDEMKDEDIWFLHKAPNDTVVKKDKNYDIAIRAAQKISEITNQFHWSGSYVDIGPINPKLILEHAYGSCVEETEFQTMVLRSLGIACAVDFVFNYPERNAGHSWSVVFDLKGNTVQNNCHNPVGAGTWVDVFAKGKVYRKTNSINRDGLFMINKNNEPIPPQFQNPYFKDVTKEYVSVRDLVVPVNDSIVPNNYGYLMVFNNDTWVPIGWGEFIKKNEQVSFKDVEPGPIYMGAFYDGRDYIPFNKPFHFDSLGIITYIQPTTDSIPFISLFRKSPNRNVTEQHHQLIIGGSFEGANKPDFSDAVYLGEITDSMLEPIFHVMDVHEQKSFKYVRYVGPDKGRCNISELIFIATNGDTLKGEIIGTEGSNNHNGKTKHLAFDGDVLTYFDAPEESGDWVGLKFKSPVRIGKIRFVARNDGNMVEVGDTYELVFWNSNKWTSLGRQVATSDSLIFEKVPKGGLYWLQNQTKGWEERIFTLDKNNKPIWW